MTHDDAAWLQAVETLLAKAPPLRHEISLRYALGKYFDDVGQYDEAFSNYRRANELTKRFGSSYDRAKLTQRVDRIISAFDAAFVSQCQDGASASELPVFIIGMPRSGTSLTEQILASHPAVFRAGEVKFWDSAFDALAAGGRASGDGAGDSVSGRDRRPGRLEPANAGIHRTAMGSEVSGVSSDGPRRYHRQPLAGSAKD